jgi:hypothetical protein
MKKVGEKKAKEKIVKCFLPLQYVKQILFQGVLKPGR